MNFMILGITWSDVAALLRTIIYFISTFIYQLIIYLYNIFDRLCNARILDSEILGMIAKRIGVVLGIIMLFMVMFSVVQLILEPEKLTDKEKGAGNIVKKILLVIVMLGLSSSAFSLLYGVQKTVINSGIISKFILPYEIKEEAQDNFGGILAAELFTAFFDLHERYQIDGISGDEENIKACVTQLKSEIIMYGTFTTGNGNECLNKRDANDHFYIDFNWILLPLVGGFAVYFIFSYCLSIGMRTFQLAFLEIIAPMAIVSYLSPKKDTMLQKWWKIYFSTYIDVFVRIAIINVAVFLIGVIFDANMSGTFWESVGGKSDSFFTNTLLTVFTVMSLLMFAKKAPDLLKELFPSGASKLGMGITSPKKLIDNMAGADLIKRGYGAVNVGAGAWMKNMRKAVGNAITETDDKGKAWLRVAGTAAFGGLGGITRGIMTKDAAGRRRAIDNAYAARQSKYKMRDLGYGGFKNIKQRGLDVLRGWGLQDQYLEDMADMKDLAIATEQRKLAHAQENYTGNQTISKMKSGNGYFIEFKDSAGKNRVLEFKKGAKQVQYIDASGHSQTVVIDQDALGIANMQAAIGKATADSKKLRQKAEEQKQKSDKK